MWSRAPAVLLGALFLIPPPASALELGDSIPGLRLTPFLSEQLEYDDNLFQVPTGAKDDLILKTIPGFLVEYSAGPHALGVGYRAEILRYLDRSSQDTENHFGLGQLKLKFPRVIVNLRDDFTQTNAPPNSELTGPIVSRTNVLAPAVEYRLTSRFSLGGNYGWTRVNFERSDLSRELDRDEHLIGASLFWKFRPRADLSLNYGYGLEEFDTATDRDVTRNLVTVALRGDLTAKLSSTFRAGVEHREPEGSGLRDITSLILGGDWNYRPTSRTTISLLTNRSLQESVFGTGKFFVSTVATLTASHTFVRKFSTALSLTGGTNEYPTKETVGGRTKWRNDLLLSWGGGLGYEIQRWMRVRLDFTHALRDSNFNEFDFGENKISASMTFEF